MASRLGMSGAGRQGHRAYLAARAGQIAWQSGTKAASGVIATVPITVTRANGLRGAVGCHVASADGTALAGVNYVAIDDTVSFTAGVTTATVNLQTLAGAIVGSATLTITLSAPTGGATLVAPTVCTVTMTPPA